MIQFIIKYFIAVSLAIVLQLFIMNISFANSKQFADNDVQQINGSRMLSEIKSLNEHADCEIGSIFEFFTSQTSWNIPEKRLENKRKDYDNNVIKIFIKYDLWSQDIKYIFNNFWKEALDKYKKCEKSNSHQIKVADIYLHSRIHVQCLQEAWHRYKDNIYKLAMELSR